MRYPLINKRARQSVVVPDLAGGLNLRDSLSMTADNQLTDCVNMWFKDGVLKTRPGVGKTTYHASVSGDSAFAASSTRVHDIYETVTDTDLNLTQECRLVSAFEKTSKKLYFFWVGEDVFVKLPTLTNATENYFVVHKDSIIYCFLGNRTIYKLENSSSAWQPLSENDLYHPLVLVNGKPIVTYTYECNGDLFEAYNLLTDRYRAVYSTYNIDTTLTDRDGNLICVMVYNLPVMPKEGSEIIIKHTLTDGTIAEHKLTVVSNNKPVKEAEKNPVDQKKVRIFGTTISFYDDSSEYSEAVVMRKDYCKDNLEVSATYSQEVEWKKVFNMQFGTWFGGGSEGISGGTRVFLGGNTAEPNLVLWSDLNNPLYFPENNYFYVGDSSQAVTAFGKQSDMLVIFKQNETYYTQYTQNNSITAENLINQEVVDYLAESVYFPLVQINPNIGCDCPNTVQLCRNRLVWANSNGRVYTLTSNNQYNERNIFEVGEMVYRKLQDDKKLKSALSCDWDGCYMLVSGENIYIMDYNSYGYQYVSSYSKNEDANLRIPWYFGNLPKIGSDSGRLVFTVYDKLKLFSLRSNGVITANISEEFKTDDVYITDSVGKMNWFEQPISCSAQTKLFEFGAPGYLKNIDLVSIALGNNNGTPIKVDFVTDVGSEENEIFLEDSDSELYSPGYIKSVALNPCIKSVLRFGVKLSCEGQMAVDGITINYRILGGAR